MRLAVRRYEWKVLNILPSSFTLLYIFHHFLHLHQIQLIGLILLVLFFFILWSWFGMEDETKETFWFFFIPKSMWNLIGTFLLEVLKSPIFLPGYFLPFMHQKTLIKTVFKTGHCVIWGHVEARIGPLFRLFSPKSSSFSPPVLALCCPPVALTVHGCAENECDD